MLSINIYLTLSLLFHKTIPVYLRRQTIFLHQFFFITIFIHDLKTKDNKRAIIGIKNNTPIKTKKLFISYFHSRAV